jgi:hypothetical protein
MNKLISIPLVLVAGCTVMVNGKPRKIGGGTDPTPATATASPAAPAAAQQPATAAAPAPTQAPARRGAVAAAQIVKIDPSLTSVPIVTRVEGVAFDTTYSKQHGHGNSPDCGSEMTSAPIASIELAQPMPSMHISVVGGSNDGFVLRRGDSLWFACTHSTSQIPAISALKEGWQPGRYDIYPLSRYSKHAKPAFSVEVFDPEKPAVWSDGVKQVSIPAKLAAPVFVEVTTKASRRVMRAEHAGWGCDKDAFAAEPDIALVIERPIPGLIVRPLPTPTPVTLRKELRDAKRPDRGCPKAGQRSSGSQYTPSYHAPSEIHFDNDDEGTYGISVGTASHDRPTTVTLMIYDASTKLDPFAKHPYAGDAGALERRWLGLHFPQLDLRELTATRDYAHAELTAKLFAAAPQDAFVYAKLDLDKDIASGPSDAFPKKGEPLLVLEANNGRAEVLAADGLRYHVKSTHVLLAPDGEPAIPAAPRPLGKLGIGSVMALLPPSAKGMITAHEKRIDAHEKCVDRVWAPYGRQLPTITRPSGVDIVYYESARTKNIRAAGNAAVDRKCGTREAQDKKTEATRVKMLAEVDKARAKLLVIATASLR